MVDSKPCRLCGSLTNIIFNVKLQPIPICHSCSNSITLQNVHGLIESAPNVDLQDRIIQFCSPCEHYDDESGMKYDCKIVETWQ